MRVLSMALCLILLAGCAGSGEGMRADSAAETPQPVLIKVEEPEPMEVPAPVELASDTDWKGKVHNKEIEVIEVLNVINPVAAYITAGFEQYGDRFSDVLNEEWGDTQVQLTAALTLYESCKQRKADGAFDKQLFLDLEEVWQLLVKTGVAGVRTKSMVDSEVKKITAT